MNRKTKATIALAFAPILFASVTGCRIQDGILGVDRCANVPAGAIPAMPGSHLCQWEKAQVDAASTDLGVFYQADFVGDSDALGPAAHRQVSRLVQQQLVGRIPIIVEPTSDPMQNLARQHSVAAAFTSAGVSMLPEQVVIAYPPAIGLDGYRAQQVARAASRGGRGGQGGSSGSGGGMGGGFGGGGGGMGSGGIF